MKRFVCAVFDTAVQAYGQPFFVPARAAAQRSFSDEINRPAQDNALYNHPEDYELYLLAEFDDQDGTFKNGNELIVRGKDCVKAKESQPGQLPMQFNS